MLIAASRPAAIPELVELSREATAALDALLADAVAKVRERVVVEGHPIARLFDREQRATHARRISRPDRRRDSDEPR
jgi:(2S)-methylsuccinyl-CoA dehydrogenase